jgi:hypothetical protein
MKYQGLYAKQRNPISLKIIGIKGLDNHNAMRQK